MATATPPSIATLPAAPDPNNRATFNTLAYPWSAALPTFGTQISAVASNVLANATDAAATSSASATSAGAALASQTAAGTSATSAATNQASVQTLTSAFNVLYLGAKSADPTLDNSGAALVNGAFYTNTVSGNIRAYTVAGGWVTGISAVAGVSSVNSMTGSVTIPISASGNIYAFLNFK